MLWKPGKQYCSLVLMLCSHRIRGTCGDSSPNLSKDNKILSFLFFFVSFFKLVTLNSNSRKVPASSGSLPLELCTSFRGSAIGVMHCTSGGCHPGPIWFLPSCLTSLWHVGHGLHLSVLEGWGQLLSEFLPIQSVAVNHFLPFTSETKHFFSVLIHLKSGLPSPRHTAHMHPYSTSVTQRFHDAKY